MKPGEALWWTGNDIREVASPFKVGLWSNAPASVRVEIKTKAMALFPEIFGTRSTKYAAFAMWLLNDYGLVSSNVRDIFTAGGQANLKVGDRIFRNIRKVVNSAVERRAGIIEVLTATGVDELQARWACELPADCDKVGAWLDLLKRRGYVNSTAHDLLRIMFQNPNMEVRKL